MIPAGAWELRLLGPVELWVAGRPEDCGPPQQRHTLAALAVDAGRPVPLDTLIGRVWDEPPPGARRSVQAHLARIRQLLGGAALVRRAGGYLLDIDPSCVDLLRLERLSSGTSSLERLREARGLWRGEPLAGMTGRWAEQTREACRRQFLDATAAWALAEIAEGSPEASIGPLRALIAEHPFAEPLSAALMRALCAAGRTAEALEHFAVARRTLAEDLGAGPGADLRAVHTAILRGDLTPRPAPVAAPAAPSQLPADVSGFVGRAEEADRLDRLATASGGGSTALTIAVLTGPPGVGKTRLAVHWAHRARDRFPDGQLFLNLRGFDADAGMTPAEALRDLLDGLGVPAEQLPASPDARAARFRSLVSGRRILLVLDNARDADQIRPLLPGTPTAMVVVTSRDRLTSLQVTNGAQPIPVDLLSFDDARKLFTQRVGAADPHSVARIITSCGLLPLAVTLAAARAGETTSALSELAEELDDESARLDAFDIGDLRAVFSWSLAALTPAAARLFRLLGVHPGPDISVDAAASLAEQPIPATRRLLQELVRASLAAERTPGRYAMHDLLRAYAAELAAASEDAPAARTRLLDHYLRLAYSAALRIEPERDTNMLPVDSAGGHAWDDAAAAQRWQLAEHVVLLALFKMAAAAGLDTVTFQLAWSLDRFLMSQRQAPERVMIWRAAVPAAERLGARLAEATAHRNLGLALSTIGRFDEADSHARQSCEIHRADGDRVREARTWRIIGVIASRRGDVAAAITHTRRSIDELRMLNHERGLAQSLNSLGWYYTMLGDARAALPVCQEATRLAEQNGDQFHQAAAHDSLGVVFDLLGEHERSVEEFERALALLRATGDRNEEVTTLSRLGDAYHRLGDEAAARRAWTDAAKILDGPT